MTLIASGLLWIDFWHFLLAIAVLGTVSSTVFLGMVLVAAWRFRRNAGSTRERAQSTPSSKLPPVTILKPVHGMEPSLAENLESFFQQDYPEFEIIIGARDADNAALRIADEVRRRYPNIKSSIVLSGPPLWPNAKVFSLEKMTATTAHDYLVISDSDVRVSPKFLRNVIPSLLDPNVGMVTCPYRGIPAGDFSSTLEALGMSVEMPSGVLVADMMEGMRFAMGAVMVVRRDALAKIGGIAATRDYYSDDFVLGNQVWAAGYRVVLSHHIVGHVLMPRPFFQSFGDQLRWMKSTRYSRPAGHIGSGLTYAMPFGVLGFLSSVALNHTRLAVALLAAAFANRVIQSIVVGWSTIRDPRALRYCWLYPLRDLLGFFTWLGSFTSHNFLWRGEVYRFGEGGRITPQHRPAAAAAGDSVRPAL